MKSSKTRRIPVFLQGLLQMPLHWQLWVALLMTLNGLAPLFFLPARIAGEALVAMALGMALAERHGFTRLLGVMHLPWLLLVPRALASIPGSSGGLRTWLIALVAADCASLLLDALDILRYLAGDREPSVPPRQAPSAIESASRLSSSQEAP